MFELMLKQKNEKKNFLVWKMIRWKWGRKKILIDGKIFFLHPLFYKKKTLFVKISAFDPLESDYRKYSIGFAKTFLQKKLFN